MVTYGMSEKDNLDPFGMARTWMAQWEKLVNEHGSQFLSNPESTRAIQALTGAMLKVQATTNEATGRMLAAANLPSRADVEALGARLSAMETSLARIEARLRKMDPQAESARIPIRRTRKPGQ